MALEYLHQFQLGVQPFQSVAENDDQKNININIISFLEKLITDFIHETYLV